MTTVSTMEDVIRLMREQPDIQSEVRRVILTAELLELPQKFSVMAGMVADNTRHIGILTERMDILTARVEDNTHHIGILTERMDTLTARVEDNTRHIGILTERMDTLTARVEDLTVRMDILTARVDDLTVRVDELTARVDTLTVRVDALTVRTDILTARVDALTVRVDELMARVDALTVRVDELTARVDTLTVRVDELTDIVRDMAVTQGEHTKMIKGLEDKMGDFAGDRLERRIATLLPPRLSQMLGLRRTRIMHYPSLVYDPNSSFTASIEDAADRGVITDEQEYRIKATDLIVYSRRKKTGEWVWIAAEASGSIGQRDIERALGTAVALRAVFEEEAFGVVIGHRIRDEDRMRADSAGVMVIEEEA